MDEPCGREARWEKQTQKTTTVWFHSQEVPRGVRSTETGSRWWGQGLGEGTGSQCFTGTESQFGNMRKFWRWWWGWLQDNVNVLNATELCTQKWLRWWILCYVDFYHKKVCPPHKTLHHRDVHFYHKGFLLHHRDFHLHHKDISSP